MGITTKVWVKRVVSITALAVTAVRAMAVYGNARWNAGTTQLLNRLDAATVHGAPQYFDARELEGLPAPVKRHFQAVLKDGQPIITAITLQHTGTFNMGETLENWKPFTSTLRVVMHRPGFDWDARVMLLPGVAAHMHDAYIAGSGLLKVAISGLIPVADLPATEALAHGEFMRFCAEAAWYPSALLPSQGALWQAVDAQTADATFTDAAITVKLRYTFSSDGLISTVLAQARGRLSAQTQQSIFE